MKGTLISREEAIKRVGQEAIAKIDKLNCEPTSRVGLQGYPDDWTEWTAAIKAVDVKAYKVWIMNDMV